MSGGSRSGCSTGSSARRPPSDRYVPFRSAIPRDGAFPIRTLITVELPVERAILVAAPRKGSSDAEHMGEHLEELARLVDTAGAEVVGRLTQQVAAPNPATLLGEGKVGELKERVAEDRATLAIFDEELSPVQGVNLERELGFGSWTGPR